MALQQRPATTAQRRHSLSGDLVTPLIPPAPWRSLWAHDHEVGVSEESDPSACVALEEIAGDPPILDAFEIEGIASDLWVRTGTYVAETLARAAGCELFYTADVRAGVYAILLPDGQIVARPCRDQRRVDLAILHEVAHWLLRRHAHSHGDVWCLTLALAMPLPLLRRMAASGPLSTTDVYWTARVPTWAIAARLAMPTVARVA